MEFTRRVTRNFKRLYLKYFHENLSDEEAMEKAEYLVRAYEAVYGRPNEIKFFDNKEEK